MKIGIDIIKVARISKMSENAKSKIFTESELRYATKKYSDVKKQAETLAGIFACKEAYLKALGIGILNGAELKSIEITHSKLGQPEIKGKDALVSITHDAGIAAAVALLL